MKLYEIPATLKVAGILYSTIMTLTLNYYFLFAYMVRELYTIARYSKICKNHSKHRC